jgi:acylphosphatase
MVGFRFWTRGEALARDLRGSAVNLPDGRVEVVLEGPRSSVQSMVEALSSGPPSARVDGVDTRWESPTGERGFGLG